MVKTMLSKKIPCENYMIEVNKVPTLNTSSNLKDVIDIMNHHKLGTVCIIDNKSKLKGIITDGDIRRKLISIQKPLPAIITDDLKLFYSKKPKCVSNKISIYKALKIMNTFRIWDLPVVDKGKKLIGVLHLHFILKKIFFDK